MLAYAVAYLATAVVFFGLDFIWLSRVSTAFYKSHLGELLLEKPNLVVAALFYLVYISGIIYFCVSPALASERWTTAAVKGAMLGLVAYGTYDMTNLATLKNWSVTVSIVDIAWGVVLTAMAATGGYFITRLFVNLD